MPFKMNDATQTFLLNLGMVDLLAESEIEPMYKKTLSIQAIEEQRKLKKEKYATILEKFPQMKLDNFIESYKSSYKVINSDLLKISLYFGNISEEQSGKILNISNRINELINKKKQQEDKSGALTRCWDRIKHFFSFKGLNTEAEYAKKVFQEITLTSKKHSLDTLKKWDGKSLENNSIKIAILTLTPKEIENGARGDLFKLATSHHVADQFKIMDLFNTDEKKKAFLIGVAQRKDCLFQVSKLIAHGFAGHSRENENGLLEFHRIAQETGIETIILSQFMDLQKHYSAMKGKKKDYNIKEEVLIDTIQRERPLQHGLSSIQGPSYFKQYIAELFIQKACRTKNFDEIVDLVNFDETHLPIKMKSMFEGIFLNKNANDPNFPLFLLKDNDLEIFRRNVKREAFDDN